MAKDFLKQELAVGDQVILFSVYRKKFLTGVITKINKRLIYVTTSAKENNQLKRDSKCVVKIK